MTTANPFDRLDRFGRVPLLDAPTPLTEIVLPEVAERGLRLFLKREDLGATGGGGNKLRKLEVALAAAREAGADTIITYGALQSNHARLTAAASARLGLRCHLVLSEKVSGRGASYEDSGNLLLSGLFGARIHRLDADVDPARYGADLAADLRIQGHAVYIVPFGGSDLHGTIGMARVAVEAAEQLRVLGLTLGSIAVASGSGATQAGLMLGAVLSSPDVRVLGLSILNESAILAGIVEPLAREAAQALGIGTAGQPDIDDSFVGPGYGQPYDAMLETIADFARRTGILLDPVYTGKAMHGLLSRIADGKHDRDGCIVFVHTGGVPGLFAYAECFRSWIQPRKEIEHV